MHLGTYAVCSGMGDLHKRPSRPHMCYHADVVVLGQTAWPLVRCTHKVCVRWAPPLGMGRARPLTNTLFSHVGYHVEFD